MSARRGSLPAFLDDGIVYVIRYLRVSGKEQKDKGLSIPTQDAETTAYTLSKSRDGWVEDSRFEDVLRGTRDDRVGYQAALSRLRELRQQGKRSVIVVFRTDRFGRRITERMERWDELQELGVELHAVYEGGKQERMSHAFRAIFSEEEVMTLRDRVSGFRRFVEQRGWRAPGRAAWGYRWRPSTDAERGLGAPKTVLAIDERARPYAEEAWRRRASGESIHAVGIWLAGLPTEVRGDRTLDYAQARQMFLSPVYCGRFDVGDVDVLARPLGNWPALVDDATWLAVQGQRAKHAGRPAQATGRYLLTGLLRCWRCGHRMDGRSFLPKASRERGTGKRRVSYRCISRMRGAEGVAVTCVAEVPAAEAERLVMERVGPILAALAAPDAMTKLARHEQRERVRTDDSAAALSGRLGAETARMHRAQAALAAAGTARLLKEIGEIEYAVIRDANLADMQAAQAALAEMRGRGPVVAPPALPLLLARVPGWSAAFDETHDLGAARVALGELVEMIMPEPGPKWSREWRVEIKPTVLGLALFQAAQALGVCPVGELANPNLPTRCSSGAAPVLA